MWRATSLENTLMRGKFEGKQRRYQHRLDSITNSMDMNLSEFQEMVEDQGAWCAAVHGVTKSWTRFSHWTKTTAMRIHTVVNTTALREGKYYREKQKHFLIYMIFLLFLPFPPLWKIGDTGKYFFTVRKQHVKRHEARQPSLALRVRSWEVVRSSQSGEQTPLGGVGGNLSHCPHARSRRWDFRSLYFWGVAQIWVKSLFETPA